MFSQKARKIIAFVIIGLFVFSTMTAFVGTALTM